MTLTLALVNSRGLEADSSAVLVVELPPASVTVTEKVPEVMLTGTQPNQTLNLPSSSLVRSEASRVRVDFPLLLISRLPSASMYLQLGPATLAGKESTTVEIASALQSERTSLPNALTGLNSRSMSEASERLLSSTVDAVTRWADSSQENCVGVCSSGITAQT